MKIIFRFSAVIICLLMLLSSRLRSEESVDLWKLANENKDVQIFSLFIGAGGVDKRLADKEGINKTIALCKETGITRVNLETFRGGHRATKKNLKRAEKMFKENGIDVRGAIALVHFGDNTDCFNRAGQQKIVFDEYSYAARMFDEVIIDDFWCMWCDSEDANKERLAKTFTVNGKKYTVKDDSWESWRTEVMYRMSVEAIKAARKANKNIKLILKYPHWYDDYYEQGYDVVRETELFDKIWCGTETRDYESETYGGRPGYFGYYAIKWAMDFGGDKCQGGWYDNIQTSSHTYIEQARVTVLSGIKESLLFGTRDSNAALLRKNMPELFKVAGEVQKRKDIGVAAYHPPYAVYGDDFHVFDFIGMMGVPLVPSFKFPGDAEAAFFSLHSLADKDFIGKLKSYISTGRPVLMTHNLSVKIKDEIDLDAKNVHIITFGNKPHKKITKMKSHSIMDFPQKKIDKIRNIMLEPFGVKFNSPNKVSLFLYNDGSWVIENFRDDDVKVKLNSKEYTLKARGWIYDWK